MKIIINKIQSDLDGYAGAYAYEEFLNRKSIAAKAVCVADVPIEVRYLIGRFKLKEMSRESDLIRQADKIILFDASDIRGMPDFDRLKVVEVIDHRPTHEAEKIFPNAMIQIEMVGAAATLIAERFIKADMRISQDAAILLYCAIVIHSINLKGNMVTDRDKKVVNWLKEQTEIPEGLVHDVLVYKSDWRRVNLKHEILKERKQNNFHGVEISIGQLEVINLEDLILHNKEVLFDLIDKMKDKDGTDLGFMNMVDLEGGYSILMAKDVKMQEILNKVLNVEFVDGMARSEVPYLRKELIFKIFKISKKQDTISK